MSDPITLYAATVRKYGEGYSLARRDSGHDGITEIEVRGPKAKYSVATDVDDPMAALFVAVPEMVRELVRLTANNDARERLLTRRTDTLRAAERRIAEMEAEWRRLGAGRAGAGCGHWVTMHEDSATVEELGNEVVRLRARVAEMDAEPSSNP